jgi:hypothetical protein
MLEAHITIDRDLIIKGYKKAHAVKVLGDAVGFYGWRLLLVWLAVAAADGMKDREDLIGIHLFIVLGAAAALSIHTYYDWTKKLAGAAADGYLHVVLDDEGVTIKNDNDKRIEWDSYSHFKEYEDYLEITHSSGEISFLPKTDELADVIVFTKTKIPSSDF